MHSDCKNEMFTILNIITNNIQWFTRLFQLELYSLFVLYISIFYA